VFIDPPRSLYLLLMLAVIIAGGVAAKYQSRKSLLAFLGIAALLLALYLVDTFVESPREQATRRVQMMAQAAQAGDVDGFVAQTSQRYNANGRTRDSFRDGIPWHLIREHRPTVTTWNFSRDDFQELDNGDIEIGFEAKAEAPSGMMWKYARAQFTKEPDGTWRMKSIEFYNPATKQKEPLPGI